MKFQHRASGNRFLPIASTKPTPTPAPAPSKVASVVPQSTDEAPEESTPLAQAQLVEWEDQREQDWSSEPQSAVKPLDGREVPETRISPHAASVFVANLPSEPSDEEMESMLRDLIGDTAKLIEVKIVSKSPTVARCAFLQCETLDQAQEIVSTRTGAVLKGSTIRCELAKAHRSLLISIRPGESFSKLECIQLKRTFAPRRVQVLINNEAKEESEDTASAFPRRLASNLFVDFNRTGLKPAQSIREVMEFFGSLEYISLHRSGWPVEAWLPHPPPLPWHPNPGTDSSHHVHHVGPWEVKYNKREDAIAAKKAFEGVSNVTVTWTHAHSPPWLSMRPNYRQHDESNKEVANLGLIVERADKEQLLLSQASDRNDVTADEGTIEQTGNREESKKLAADLRNSFKFPPLPVPIALHHHDSWLSDQVPDVNESSLAFLQSSTAAPAMTEMEFPPLSRRGTLAVPTTSVNAAGQTQAPFNEDSETDSKSSASRLTFARVIAPPLPPAPDLPAAPALSSLYVEDAGSTTAESRIKSRRPVRRRFAGQSQSLMSLYIPGLFHGDGWNVQRLNGIFSAYAGFQRVYLKGQKGLKHRSEGPGLRPLFKANYAIVDFKTEEDAAKALQSENDQTHFGVQFEIEYQRTTYRPLPPNPSSPIRNVQPLGTQALSINDDTAEAPEPPLGMAVDAVETEKAVNDLAGTQPVEEAQTGDTVITLSSPPTPPTELEADISMDSSRPTASDQSVEFILGDTSAEGPSDRYRSSRVPPDATTEVGAQDGPSEESLTADPDTTSTTTGTASASASFTFVTPPKSTGLTRNKGQDPLVIPTTGPRIIRTASHHRSNSDPAIRLHLPIPSSSMGVPPLGVLRAGLERRVQKTDVKSLAVSSLASLEALQAPSPRLELVNESVESTSHTRVRTWDSANDTVIEEFEVSSPEMDSVSSEGGGVESGQQQGLLTRELKLAPFPGKVYVHIQPTSETREDESRAEPEVTGFYYNGSGLVPTYSTNEDYAPGGQSYTPYMAPGMVPWAPYTGWNANAYWMPGMAAPLPSPYPSVPSLPSATPILPLSPFVQSSNQPSPAFSPAASVSHSSQPVESTVPHTYHSSRHPPTPGRQHQHRRGANTKPSLRIIPQHPHRAKSSAPTSTAAYWAAETTDASYSQSMYPAYQQQQQNHQHHSSHHQTYQPQPSTSPSQYISNQPQEQPYPYHDQAHIFRLQQSQQAMYPSLSASGSGPTPTYMNGTWTGSGSG